MLSKLGLKMKLLFAFGLILGFLVIIGLVSFVSLNKVTDKYSHIAEVNLPNAIYLSNIQAAQKDSIIAVSTLLGTNATPADVETQLKFLDTAIQQYEAAAKAYENIPFVLGEEEKWNAVKAAWTPYIQLSRRLIELSRSNTKEDNGLRDRLGNSEFMELRKSFNEKLIPLIEFQAEETKVWAKTAKDTEVFGKILTVVTAILGAVIGLAISFLLAQSLSSLLSGISKQLSDGAEKVSGAAHEISTSSSELSASTTQQAAALQETVSAVDEVNTMVGKNSENAIKSKETADTSLDIADKGQKAVSDMIHSIEEINSSNNQIMSQIENSNKQMAEIVQVITEISNKTKVINDIVFQTKLLSFNASVEAARAGEHGKGFAVVAEEVGSLAQMSGNAAKEIFDMLGTSSEKVERIVRETKSNVEKLMQDGQQKVEDGTVTAKHCAEVFAEIVKNVNSLSEMVNEISVASQEQAKGVQEISQAMQQADQTTQQNATATGQVAASAEVLSNQAQLLNQSAQVLLATIEGQK